MPGLGHREFHGKPPGNVDLNVYTEILNGRKIHIRVHFDQSYRQQSSATLDVWDGERWNNAVTLLPQTIMSVHQAEDELITIAHALLWDGREAALDDD